MQFRLCFILFCSLFLIGESAESQNLFYIGIEQGLSNNTVTTIHKDKFGLMWFGTLDGLCRYDGYTFKTFRNNYGDSTSLPNDIITAIESDGDGNIWVGTQKGLAVFDSKTLQFSNIYYTNGNKKSVFDKWVNDIKKDAAGNIYIGSANGGLFICNKGSRNATAFPFINHRKAIHQYTVTAINVDGKNVWAAIENVGLCYYNSKALIDVSGYLPYVTSIRSGHDGNLWIGTRIGLYTYQRSTNKIEKFDFKDKVLNNCKITDLLFDKKKCLWVASDGEGVIEINAPYNAVSKHFRQGALGGLSSDAIYTIYEDELSRKWIGTLRGGIDVIDNKKNQFVTYRQVPGNSNSLVNNFTFSFCEDDSKNIWIGTDGGGLSIWNRKNNTFQNYVYKPDQKNGITNNYITSIVKDDTNNMWLSTYGQGVLRYNKSNSSFENIPFRSNTARNGVWKIYKDQKNDIWATCLRGMSASYNNNRLFKFNAADKAFLPVPFSVNAEIISLIDDGPENFWLGSFTGLLHANKQTGINKSIDFNSAVRSLYKSRSGILWIGTYGRGLFSLNEKSGALKNYTEKDGLCDNKILNIEEDAHGNIWLSTYNGISKFNPNTVKFENFYAADGLQSNQFYYNASAHLSTGELIFGGIKGFNIFYPDSIRQYHDFPKLIVAGLRIANTPVNADNDFFPGAGSFYNIDHIRLPYNKAIISLDYVALEYSLPGKIQYAYFLKGADKAWNYVDKQRSINYSQLNEGHYTLKIKSTNASGIWNTKEMLIDIVVLPPWYRTWWAYLLYFTAFSGAIYTYLYYHKKQTQLQYEVKFVNELNEKKIAFFTNISHELRTPLTLIVNPIKDLLQSNGANLDLVDISAVYRNSRRLLSLVDQLLLFRSSENEISDLKPSLLNLKDVCYEVFLCFNNQVKAKKLSYRFKCESDDIYVNADREKLEIILFNLLSNAIKYTPENGEIDLEIDGSGQFAEILVKDTGRGIPPEIGEKLFEKLYRLPQDNDTAYESGFGIGLFLAKKYTEIHKGNLTYKSSIGEGTTFKVRLPKTNERPLLPTVELHDNIGGTFPLLHELIEETAENDVVDKNANGVRVNEIMDGVVNEKPVILLIDDDAGVRSYVKHLLLNDYIVYEASNAEAGFDTVLEHEPDIIVCDVVMQGMSGVEFCSKIKDSSSFSHIPVILLTGSSSPEIKLKGIECGADDYITKPFENELLVARIKSLLKGRDTLKNYFFNEITLKNNSLKIPAEYSEFLDKCIRIIESHLEDESFSLKIFTEEIGMSRSKLFRKIKSISGLSSTEFIRYIRLRKAAELMIQTDLQIKEIAFRIGFQDIKYFREQFNKLFEMNPSEFIKKYRKAFTTNLTLSSGIQGRKNKG